MIAEHLYGGQYLPSTYIVLATIDVYIHIVYFPSTLKGARYFWKIFILDPYDTH